MNLLKVILIFFSYQIFGTPFLEISPLIIIKENSNRLEIEGKNLAEVSTVYISDKENTWTKNYQVTSSDPQKIVASTTDEINLPVNQILEVTLSGPAGDTNHEVIFTREKNSSNYLNEGGIKKPSSFLLGNEISKNQTPLDLGPDSRTDVTGIYLGPGIVNEGTTITSTGTVAVDVATSGDPLKTKIPFFNDQNQIKLTNTASIFFDDQVSSNTYSVYNDGSLRIRAVDSNQDAIIINPDGSVNMPKGMNVTSLNSPVCTQDGMNCPASINSAITTITANPPLVVASPGTGTVNISANTGTASGDLVVLNPGTPGKLPPVDGSQLVNIVTSINAGPAISVTPSTGVPTVGVLLDVTGGAQSYDPTLSNLASLAPGTNQVIISNASSTFEVDGGTSLLGRIGAQPADADLTSLAGLSPLLGNYIVGGGVSWNTQTLENCASGEVLVSNGQLLDCTNPSLITAGTFESTAQQAIRIKSNAGATGEIRFLGSNNTGYVAIKGAPGVASTSTTTFTLPAADGLNGQLLQTNGLGVLSFVTNNNGDVTGPAASTAGNVPTYAGTSGKILNDSGVAITNIPTIATGAGAANNLILSNAAGKTLKATAYTVPGTICTTGQVFKSDGVNMTCQVDNGDVTGPNASVDGNLSSFNGTSGKVIQDTGIASANVVTMATVGTGNFVLRSTLGNKTATESNVLVADIATMAANAGAINQVIVSGGADKSQKSTGVTIDGTNNMAGVANFTSSGNMTVDTNSLFVDSANDRVGIGTATPNASAKLDITSTTMGLLPPRMTTAQRDAIVTPSNGLLLYNSTTNTFDGRVNGAWQSISGDVGGPGTSTDNAIARFDGTTGKLIQNSLVTIDDSNNMAGVAALTMSGTLTVDTNTFFVDATNNRVGIGKTNPAQALDVTGNTNITGSLTINNNGANSSIFPTGRGNAGQLLSTDGAGALSWIGNGGIAYNTAFLMPVFFQKTLTNSAAAGGTNPPVLNANSNGIYFSNGNFNTPSFLPNPGYIANGTPFYFVTDAALNLVINKTRTDMANDLTVTTGNTAIFVYDGTNNRYSYQGTFPNNQLPADLTFNQLNNSYKFPLGRGSNGQVLTTDGAGSLSWTTNGDGDVDGPASATSTNLASFNGTTGKIIQDSGILTANVPTMATASGMINKPILSANAAKGLTAAPYTFPGTVCAVGQVLKSDATNFTCQSDSGVTGPATTTVGDIATWNNTSGTLMADSGITISNIPTMATNGVAGNLIQTAAANKALSDSGVAISNLSTAASNAASANLIWKSGGANKTLVASGVTIDATNNLTGINAITMASTLTVDSGTFYVDPTNNRIGVHSSPATVAPVDELYVLNDTGGNQGITIANFGSGTSAPTLSFLTFVPDGGSIISANNLSWQFIGRTNSQTNPNSLDLVYNNGNTQTNVAHFHTNGNVSIGGTPVGASSYVQAREVLRFYPPSLMNANNNALGECNNPPTIAANTTNGIYSSNANFCNTQYVPAADGTIPNGQPWYFATDADLNFVVKTTRTNLANDLTVTKTNTAIFIYNAATSLYEYQGTVANTSRPTPNQFNSRNNSFTLPGTRGTNGQVLTSDGAGTLSWANVGTLAGPATNTANTFPLWSGTGGNNLKDQTVLYADTANNRIGILNSTPNYSLDVVGNANVGVTATTGNQIGTNKLSIRGTTSSANGPFLNFYNSTDNYPKFQVLPYANGDTYLNFDTFWDTSWKGSSGNTVNGFWMHKGATYFDFNFSDLVAAGSLPTFTNIMRITPSAVTTAKDLTVTSNITASGAAIPVLRADGNTDGQQAGTLFLSQGDAYGFKIYYDALNTFDGMRIVERRNNVENTWMDLDGANSLLSIHKNTQIDQGDFLKFPHANATDVNDGKIGAGIFSEGLNIVGVQTVGGNGRRTQVWGNLGINMNSGNALGVSGNATVSGSFQAGTTVQALTGLYASTNTNDGTPAYLYWSNNRGIIGDFRATSSVGGNFDGTMTQNMTTGGWGYQSFYQLQTSSPATVWFYGNISANNVTNRSSRILKKNITPLMLDNSFMDKFSKINVVKYQWRDKPFIGRKRGEELSDAEKETKWHFGFVAEELSTLFPDLFDDGKQNIMDFNNDGIVESKEVPVKAYSSAEVTAVLVKVVQEQQKTINGLVNRVTPTLSSANKISGSVSDSTQEKIQQLEKRIAFLEGKKVTDQLIQSEISPNSDRLYIYDPDQKKKTEIENENLKKEVNFLRKENRSFQKRLEALEAKSNYQANSD